MCDSSIGVFEGLVSLPRKVIGWELLCCCAEHKVFDMIKFAYGYIV